ncbi:MAG: hypothetical protein JW829_08155 [Pirellulales bacterium]|nr:hypothetical protein [Pirellulales bacterium]
MNEANRPNLSLDKPPGALKKRASSIPKGWLILFLLMHAAALAGIAGVLMRSNRSADETGPSRMPSDPESMQTIAKELEDRGLNQQAAEAWETYLAAAPASDRAAILYRIGKLYLESDLDEKAAATFVRAELASPDNKDLLAKIQPKLLDCLRRLGRYGEVGRELSRQVEVGGKDTGKGNVLATLAGEELTDSDLDRMIERRIDQMMRMQGASGNETVRQNILRQFGDPSVRQAMLQEFLQRELFSRRARELKIDLQDDFRSMLDSMEQELLAAHFLEQELQKIQPTDIDLESYFKTHATEYNEPESMDLLLIELGTDDDPEALLQQIQSAEDFRKLAREREPDQTESESPRLHRIVRGRIDGKLGDTSSLFDLAENEWTHSPHSYKDKKFLVLATSKHAARTPDYSEVREQIRSDYIQRKQREVSERLLRDLMARFEVRIIPQKEAPQESEDPKSDQETKK